VPFAVRPIGAQLSIPRAVAGFGVGLVWAKAGWTKAVPTRAGDATKTIADTIADIGLFIGFARNLGSFLIEQGRLE
jgi:hypothetical protein